MAKHTGKNGVIQIEGTPVAQLRGWEISEQIRTVEASVMGDAAVDREPTLTDFTGSATLFWDLDDAGQAALPRGVKATMILYPDGNTASQDWEYTGDIIITEIGQSAEIEGMIERRISFEGKGALTEQQVPV